MIDKQVINLNDIQKTTLMSLSGVKDFPMRVKCATMAWHTLSTVLENKNENYQNKKCS